MQDAFIQTRGDQIILNKNDLIMYATIAAVIVVLLFVMVIAAKRRKKNFIKTMPTNLKDEV